MIILPDYLYDLISYLYSQRTQQAEQCYKEEAGDRWSFDNNQGCQVTSVSMLVPGLHSATRPEHHTTHGQQAR
jgi:hypothetical protein